MSAGEGAVADADANGTAVEGDTNAADNNGAPADNVASAQNAAAASVASEQGETKVAAASATTLSSEAKVYVQDTKDKDSSWSNKSGALKVGDTLWANMYDGYNSVSNPGPDPGSGHASCHWRRKSSCVVGPAGTGRAESARRTGSPEPKSP